MTATVAAVFLTEVVVVALLCAWMRRRAWRGYGWARKCGLVNNLLYGVASAAFFVVYTIANVLATDDGRRPLVAAVLNFGEAQRAAAVVAPLRRLYLYSKLWEFQDVLWLTLGGVRPDAQFLFHHLTTFLIAAASYERGCRGEFYVVASNLLAHAVCYVYFAGFRGPLMTRAAIALGGAQLAVGLFFPLLSVCAGQLFHAPPPSRAVEIASFAAYAIYTLLWLRDLVARPQRFIKKTIS